MGAIEVLVTFTPAWVDQHPRWRVLDWERQVTVSAEQRLSELGIELPAPVPPAANYVRHRLTGNLLFISGTGPGDSAPKGKVDTEVSVGDAYQAARSVGLQILATAQQALGSLDRIVGTVKVLGMVNSAPAFEAHPAVINGCSDLLVEVLGEAGRHTRSAVGFVSLPNSICVEIEATFEVE
ncbi:MAG: RidA family protein [Chloroflexia bacterium]|nr:RidA family protein [Chloroflexia bacterium]